MVVKLEYSNYGARPTSKVQNNKMRDNKHKLHTGESQLAMKHAFSVGVVPLGCTAHSGGSVFTFGDIQDSALQVLDLPDLIRPALSMGLK